VASLVFAQSANGVDNNDMQVDNASTVTNLQLPDLSYGFISDYLNDTVQSVTKNANFYDIIIFSAGIAIYGIFIYHFYRFIARRDIFSFDLERRLGGGRYRADGKKTSAAPRVAAYIATKFIIFPIMVFAWFLAYSMFILLLTQDLRPDKVFFVTSILIIGIRMASYYSEDLSKDLAKTIPFAILGIFLFDQKFFTVEEVAFSVGYMPQFVVEIAAFLIVAFVVEIVLSIVYLVKIKFVGKRIKNNKTGSAQAV
jgi:hypothetical protein